jgi:DNA ligase (NAD+)
MLAAGIEIKAKTQGTLSGSSFCFTGKMQNKRPVLERMVKDAGGQVKKSVVTNLTYLVTDDPDSTTTKANAARENGTMCISEEAFLKMIEGV